MSKTLTVELPDEVYESVTRAARSKGKAASEWVAATLCGQLPQRDERLRRHFGAVDLGIPTGADNEGIDADLARAYADTHAEQVR